MALSPEDVIKKSFTSPHLRRGYDETQVDDFLDEVVVELRRLNAEQASLETDLKECRAGQGSSSGSSSFVPAADARDELGVESEDLARVRRERDELVAEIDALSQRIEASQAEVERVESSAASHDDLGEGLGAENVNDADSVELEAARAEITSLRAEVEQARATTPPVDPAAATGTAEDPTSIISLAQRLHDQHVAEGQSTKTRLVGEADEYKERIEGEADARSAELISSGQITHDDLVSTGQQTHDELVTSGQQQHDTMIAEGQQEHDRLIDEAQTTHQRLLAQGQKSHDTLVREGEQTRDQLVTEAEQRRANVLSDLSDEESRVKATIEGLRTRESKTRARMRAMLSEQLTLLGDDKK